jgi:pimeloyl-ACP methyl ester carboxylesterase
LTAIASAPPPLHRLHDEEIERLLASGERRRECLAFFGEAGYRELSALARRAVAARRRGGPAVYVLPGLMGSRLGTRGRLLDDVLWLDPIEVAAGHLVRLALPRGAGLTALGAMLLNALKLKLSLQIAGFDARLHAYDWRLGAEQLATELNARIARDGAREAMLVGHSLGGVVARVALATDRGRVARVVQLGSPNHGSFAPVLALRGVYPTVRKLAALDLRHDAEDLARIIFRTLPSLHELLPDARRAAGTDLFDPAAWPEDALRPDRQQLAAAAAARERWPAGDARCLHIVGVRQETVTRAGLRDGEFHYTIERAGDGTVPLALATLDGAAHWYVAEKHGGLPNNGRVIAAVVDLLRAGRTDRLPGDARRARSLGRREVSESTLRRIAPHKVRWQDLSPDARRRLLEPVISPEFHGTVPAASLRPGAVRASGGAPGAAPGARRTIEVRLVNGSIVDANARAIVLGVFRNVDPSGAAAAVDARLGGAIREFARRRMLPGRLGEVTTLPPARGTLLAELVLFAGLGDFDDFGAEAQSYVAGNVVRVLALGGVEDFATVLFGAGSGIAVAAALEQQLGGFVAGLRDADPGQVVRRITICETDRRKYAALRRAAVRLAERLADAGLRLLVDEAAAPAAGPAAIPGARRAAKARPADPAYLLVTLLEQGRGDYECRAALLTAGAKAAVLSSHARLPRRRLRALLAQVESGSLAARDLPRFGTDLGKLLLGATVREGLLTMRRRALVVVHDREASRVPWEALHVGESCPALEQGLSRRYAGEGLSVARWQEHRQPGSALQLLVVVDPTLDLPGAADEGAALGRLLRARGAGVTCLSGGEATRERLLLEFGSGRYDALHFAGHGHFDADDPGRSGLVCADGAVLRGADLEQTGHLPALVFFNACEAARVRRRPTPAGRRLFAFRRSTSVAEAFLVGGVANFLGTHWPVGDHAALAFSTVFYERLLAGDALGECVLAARRRVQADGSIDWADYVHYGDAGFRLAPAATDAAAGD